MSVYFAESGPYMKIGYSHDPIGRMNTVTTNGRIPADLPSGATADLIGWIPGDREVERRYHRQFAATRVAGEWFWADRDAAAEIIWADPHGVDVEKMTMKALLVMVTRPDLTRDDLERAGLEVVAPTLEESMRRINALFSDVLGESA